MVRNDAGGSKDRRSNDPKSSVRAPAKKDGGGGKFTLGKAGDYGGGATVEYGDPNHDPDERRIDPDDGTAYKFAELAAFYKGKFSKQQIAEYWEYECTAVKRKSRAKAAAAAPSGPTLAESVAKTKTKTTTEAKPKPKYVVKAPPPVCMLVKLEIKPDRVEEFLVAITEDMEGSRKEKGCLRFDILRDPEAETKFVLYEVYKDAEAIAFHKEQEHFKVFVEFRSSGGVESQVVTKMSGFQYGR